MVPSSSSNARDFWSRFSGEFGAEHICIGLPYWNNNEDKVIYTHRGAKITMDCHSRGDSSMMLHTVTRIYLPLVVHENFRFGIQATNFIEEIGKFFGLQDVEFGNAAFDEKLIIKAGNEEKLRQFLSDPKIREMISSTVLNGRFGATFLLDQIKVIAQDKGEYLSFLESGIIYDVERLKSIFRLITQSLDRLKEFGLVSEEH